MYRVCILKSTGKLIEMQSGGYDDENLRDTRLNTLLSNAINAGYDKDDVSVKWVDESEYQTILLVKTSEDIEIENSNKSKTNLDSIDLGSIRAIREYLTGDDIEKDEALAKLIDLEESAKAEREKIKNGRQVRNR